MGDLVQFRDASRHPVIPRQNEAYKWRKLQVQAWQEAIDAVQSVKNEHDRYDERVAAAMTDRVLSVMVKMRDGVA